MKFREEREEMLRLNRQRVIPSLGDKIRGKSLRNENQAESFINASNYVDKFVRKMSRGDLTGVLAPTGVGKTTFILNELREILINNREGVVVIYAFEQDASEIAEKWLKMNEMTPELSDRLYVFSNFDEKDSMGISDIKLKLNLIKTEVTDNIISIALDHLHLIRNDGYGDYNNVCTELKKIAKEFNTHVYIISQTQKANQIIDVPVPRTGCYNCSQFEWICTYIISLFQPLKRVAAESGLEILGYQFSKIRYKNKEDGIKESMNYLLSFDFDTESLRPLNNDEKTKFAMYYEKVLELRQNEEKFKSFQFDLSTTITNKDGKEVKLTRYIGGNKAEQE